MLEKPELPLLPTVIWELKLMALEMPGGEPVCAAKRVARAEHERIDRIVRFMQELRGTGPGKKTERPPAARSMSQAATSTSAQEEDLPAQPREYTPGLRIWEYSNRMRYCRRCNRLELKGQDRLLARPPL